MAKLQRVEFTKAMKKDYTLLLPNMCELTFKLVKEIFVNLGYKAALLTNESPRVLSTGLKYVHNDMCYPAQLVIGQFIDAVQHCGYDSHKVALVITQTGGGCRASNYIYLLRKALVNAHLAYIPVISLSTLEKNSGFKFTTKMIMQAFAGIVYGDLISLLSSQVRPYEIHHGQTNEVADKWIQTLSHKFKNNRGYIGYSMKHNIIEMTRDFARIPYKNTNKIKVGVVGEIYIKFSPLGNNHLQEMLEEQGCEVMIPSLLGFFMYGLENAKWDYRYYGGFARWKKKVINAPLLKIAETLEAMVFKNVAATSDRFAVPLGFAHMKTLAHSIIDKGVKMGEGWLLSSEVLELDELGYSNVVCAQPFGCLANHIVAKGMIRSIAKVAPDINIVPIDYDPSSTRVNQENRIKLMLAIAQENLDKKVSIDEGRKKANESIADLA